MSHVGASGGAAWLRHDASIDSRPVRPSRTTSGRADGAEEAENTLDDHPAVPRPPAVDVADLFPELLENLVALLSDLSERDWNAPTVCEGWSVKDVALHLLGVDLGNLSVRRDGWIDPFWETSGDDLVASLNRWNQDWVVAARRLSPRLLCDLLAVTGDAAARYFASLNLAATGDPVSWAGPAPAPVWLDVAREYTERWVHQQQIRDAVDRSGLKERRYLAPVLATFVHALPVALHAIPATPGTAVRLVITGDAGGRWLAVRGEDGWMLGEDTGATAAATATLDQDLAWRLWTRGISRDDGRVQAGLEGDPRLAVAVLEMVSIIA